MLYQSESQYAFDSHFSWESVSWHKHALDGFVTYVGLAIQRAVHEGPNSVKELEPFLFSWLSDTRFLWHAWNEMAQHGGQAPGSNGLRYSDFDTDEAFTIVKEISIMLRAGGYEPTEPKKQKMSKGPGKGDRIIAIPDIQDRALARAVNEIAQPLRDPYLSDSLYGGRRRKGRLLALAEAERMATLEDRWIWMTEDINTAFDKIPTSRLRNLLRDRWPCQKTVDLILKIAGCKGKKGIYQGSSLSPYLLNEYLDRFLVESYVKLILDAPMFIYVDDILTIGPSVDAATSSWTSIRNLLAAAGLQVKAKKPCERIYDLSRGDVVEWLGFNIGKAANGISISIAEKPWWNLASRLSLVQESHNSSLLAKATIRGWLEQAGPSFKHENRETVLTNIRQLAEEQGFDEIPCDETLLDFWESGHKRWLNVRNRVAKPVKDGGSSIAEMAIGTSIDDSDPLF